MQFVYSKKIHSKEFGMKSGIRLASCSNGGIKRTGNSSHWAKVFVYGTEKPLQKAVVLFETIF